MKAVRLENFGTKTPPGKSAEEWRRKKKNLTNTGWRSAPAESGETGGKDTGAAGTPPERRPTYSETMQGCYGDRYADALAEIKPPPMPPQRRPSGTRRTRSSASAADIRAPTVSFTASIWRASARCRSVSPHRASPAA